MMQRAKRFLFTNSGTAQTIAKNTFWLFSGQIASRLIRMIIVVYGARILGVSDWGAFSYALGIASLFTIFVDFGINAVITRESLHDLKKQEEYFATSLIIKICALIVLTGVIIIWAPQIITLITQGSDAQKILPLIPFVILIMAFDGLRDFGATLSRAWEKMEIESFIQIITNIVIVSSSFAALAVSISPLSLAIGYTIGTGVGMIIAFYPFRHYFKNIFSKINYTIVKPILTASWPFGMLGLIGIINLNTDMIMLGWYRSLETVGYYSSAQKIAQLIQSIPGLIAIAFFPSLVKNILNTETFTAILEKAGRILLLLVIPITAGSVIYAPEILHFLFGPNYDPAARTLQIMSLTYIPLFIGAIFGNALFALKQEKKLFWYVCMGIGFNIMLNLVLIPSFGSSGSALSTAITTTITTGYLYWILRKKMPFSLFHEIRGIIHASFYMLIVMFLCKTIGGTPGLITGGLCGVGTYLIVLWKQKEKALHETLALLKKTESL